ncbi:MAG TPA: HupE/UreJ family protein [Chthoniobacterales bacterium]|jgi:urease accessory protein|nr:HupE/UreJ family protein [Chthoniobacterales bacterium]
MKKISLLLAALLLAPTLAHAHTGVGDTNGFAHGFGHPLFGLDHLLAMIAIGLWASQIGGRALWAVPATFVSVMAVGGVLGIAGVPVPFVEQGIATSVLLLGLLIAFSARLPLGFSVPLVALFAICHGHAHGAEMPVNASGFEYAIGFMLATAVLHGAGIGLGMLLQRNTPVPVLRVAGAAIAVVGVTFFFA